MSEPSVLTALRFRPAAHRDLPMLRDWMATPHWRQWWGEPEEELGYVRDMIEGRDSTRPYIFGMDGEDIGYIQVWFIDRHQTSEWIEDYPWLAALPSDAVGIDLSIGRAEQLSKGIGSTALRQFVEELRAEGHRTIVIDPDPENLRAVRAYQKAGFRPVPQLVGRTEGVLIMQFDPTESEPTA